MKKQLLLISAVILTAGTLVFTGCKKDDTTPPDVTVTGANPMYVSLQGTYTEPGATANDGEDGSVTATASGNVDVNTAGTYTITYTATDAAGNSGTATRTVIVRNDAYFLAGTYNADDTCQVSAVLPYTATVTVSNTLNNKFTITGFGGFGSGVAINATLSGSNVTFTLPQTIAGNGSLIAANGTITSTSAPVGFNVAYTWNDGTANETCASVYVHQ